MSPRAAWRLEALGFSPVYDFGVGKADWLAAGLPSEGDGPRPARAVDAMDAAPPTCRPEARITSVMAQLAHRDWSVCVVVNEHGVVQGNLRRGRIDARDDRHADDVMEPGPSTVRADADLAETRARMREQHVATVVVTNADGVLLGLLSSG